MGLFSRLRGKSIDDYIADADAQGIKVVDVREADEFASGHIPGAFSVPLSSLRNVTKVEPDKTKPVYVYCMSGNRSGRACSRLKAMGYAKAVNIGGINSYHGPIER